MITSASGSGTRIRSPVEPKGLSAISLKQVIWTLAGTHPTPLVSRNDRQRGQSHGTHITTIDRHRTQHHETGDIVRVRGYQRDQRIEPVQDVQQAGDVAKIESAFEAMTQASHKMAEKMYETAGPAPGAPGAAPGGDPAAEAAAQAAAGAEDKGKVVDAEFEEVKDDKGGR